MIPLQDQALMKWYVCVDRNGADGTNGIISLSSKKPIHVIAKMQRLASYGMPKAIADAGVVDEVVPLTEVAPTIIKNVGVR